MGKWVITGFTSNPANPQQIELESPDGRELVVDLETMSVWWSDEAEDDL